MSHVPPHRWADLAAGRVAPRDAETMTEHAATCPKCARGRDRVTGAHAVFPDIRTEPAPELKWDRVRAQVYWETSSKMRASQIRPRARTSMAVPIAALAGVAAIVATVASGPITRPRQPPVRASAAPAAVDTAAQRREVGVMTLMRGDVTIDGASGIAAFERTVGAASEIRTGSGEVSVQFGDGSAFAVGPRSVLRLRQFEPAAIALEIDGVLDVEVAPRAHGQRFVVSAGSRTVEVRGTGFRVERIGDSIAVRCRHGKVAVRDGAGEIEVTAGEAVDVATGATVRASRVRELAEAELAELATTAPHRLAVWAAPDAVAAMTAPLTVMAPTNRGVRVDGVVVGAGPVTVRVASGRHLVETSIDDRWVSAGWVDVRSGPIQVAAEDPPATPRDDRVRVEPGTPRKVEPRSDAGRTVRRRQLLKELEYRSCIKALEKQGLTDDTFLEVELSIDGNGAIRFANIVDTNLPSNTARCIRDRVAAIEFPRGPAATWRETIRP